MLEEAFKRMPAVRNICQHWHPIYADQHSLSIIGNVVQTAHLFDVADNL